MDINALPIQTSPTAESSNSATNSVSAEGTPSFAQQFQQANQKNATTETPASRAPDDTKQQTAATEPTTAAATAANATTDTSNTTTEVQLPGAPLLALMGMQLRLSGQNTQQSTKKANVEEAQSNNEVDGSAVAGLLAAATITPQQMVNTAQNAGLPSGTTLTATPQLTNNTDRPNPVLNASQARSDAPSYQALNSVLTNTTSSTPENSAFNELLKLAPEGEGRALSQVQIIGPTNNTPTPDALASNRIDASLLALQSAAASASNPTTQTNTPTTPLVASTVGTVEWQQDLGQHVIQLHQRGEQQIELRLHPAELGPLSITLKVGENGAQVQFVSAHAHVRNAIEQAIPQLRDALAEQGINLGQTSVGSQQQQPRDQQQTASQQSREQVDFSLDDKGVTPLTGQTLQIPTPGQLSLYA